ncbi:hypothetical protein MPTK1_4g07130 [Marchantia polymorpha subsp. ruderalis]|uniref:Uncharacterized protein n=2 Tax=Marchantia polymorpha TaxID=3197 RepID=A0AAF6B7B4_MARPO|nr:hypothetical protein MARPO_0115s0068 [Marchantia polymorpha]BBN07898.1 hypothetical protein Mp_4g07130 [Marchantia polymorpha subsp. ruderalis]|eukprot:PTQ31156.1 hypothetical protein MARPO_0115s0068 [Marchantia polymorpha]
MLRSTPGMASLPQQTKGRPYPSLRGRPLGPLAITGPSGPPSVEPVVLAWPRARCSGARHIRSTFPLLGIDFCAALRLSVVGEQAQNSSSGESVSLLLQLREDEGVHPNDG